MYNCPKCNTPFEKGEKVCKKCGYNLEKGFVYDPICPKCGRKYPAGSRLCAEDYTNLIPFEKFTPKCVLCQRSFTPDVEVCPYDGGAIRPRVGGPREENSDTPKEEVKKLAYYSEEGYIYPKAPIGLRYKAYYYDSTRAGLLIFPLFVLTVILAVSLPDNFNSIIFLSYFIIGILSTMINILRKDTFQEGQSRGKKKYGLMIVDIETNMPCSKKKAIQRNIPLAIPLIGSEELQILWDSRGRRSGDRFCNTQVIEVSQYAPELTREFPDTKSI